MPSRLLNLTRVLTWNDFARVRGGPPPGQTIEVAQTAADIAPSGFGVERVPGTSSVRMRDSVEVKIDFKPRNSWVFDWVFTQSQQYQSDLLNHENGHYKIVALIGRDFFLALMALKGNTYPNAGALQADLNQASSSIAAKAQPAQDKYDDLTHNGTDPAQQTLWDGYISRSFTTAVSPPQQAADGASIKIPLLTVLSQAGITI